MHHRARHLGGSPSATVDVAGLGLHVATELPGDLDLVRRVVGERPWSGPPDAELELGPRAPSLPRRPPDFEGPYGDHWDDGQTHAFRHHWGLAAVVTASHARLGGPAVGYARWVTVRNSMLFVLARLMLTQGRFVLHAAALRDGDAGALVAVGDSGAGKSTLAFLAHRAGWDVLGDDMVVVDPLDPTTVRGIPRVPSVPADVAELLATRGDELPDDERGRLELTGLELDPRSAPVAGIVVCGHAQGDGAVEAVDAASVLGALVPAFVLSALEDPVRRWFPVATALARRPAVRLLHARDPVRRAEDAPRLLAEVVGRTHTPRGPEPSQDGARHR